MPSNTGQPYCRYWNTRRPHPDPAKWRGEFWECSTCGHLAERPGPARRCPGMTKP